MHLEASDQAACACLLRGGSRSFHAASRLLPAQVRTGAMALYAFCRVADDAIDNAAPEHRAAALADLHTRLANIYAGTPGPDPADRAFAAAVRHHALPHAFPAALLEGFAWDAEGRRYADLAALHQYAVRVAGTVGGMMAHVMGVQDHAVLARAMELGLAMQLSNIARDVGEDAREGRLYLPLSWLEEAGIDADAFLRNPVLTPALRGVVARLLAEADRLYASATAGIAHLPLACRPAIHAARLFYQAIGHTAGAPGFNPVTTRAVVSTRRKQLLLPQALAASFQPPQSLHPHTEAAIHSLLAQTPTRPPQRAPEPKQAGRLVWIIDLFTTLEAR